KQDRQRLAIVGQHTWQHTYLTAMVAPHGTTRTFFGPSRLCARVQAVRCLQPAQRRYQEIGMKVLVIEDEYKGAAYLRKGLTENGFTVDVVREGEDGLHAALTGAYDIIILDVMLPGRDGWSVLTNLRCAGKETPVIFLTARDSVPDRVKGLQLGA